MKNKSSGLHLKPDALEVPGLVLNLSYNDLIKLDMQKENPEDCSFQ